MSVKDLFKSRSNKIVTKQHVEQLKDEVESKVDTSVTVGW